MNRGAARRRVFFDDSDHGRFVALLDEVSTRWQVEFYAYCCMSNHYHLLLRTPHGNLSRVMRQIDGVYTQGFNRAHARDGPLLRGRYKAIVVDTDEYLLGLVRYVHRNPVRAGTVSTPGAYAWSSHRQYFASGAPWWLSRAAILDQFSSLHAFEEFTRSEDDPRLLALFCRRRWSPFLGSRAFIEKALAYAKRTSEHPRAQTTPQFPGIDAIVDAVCTALGVQAHTVSRGRRGYFNLARNLLIYVSSRIAGFPHGEIRRHFHLGRDSAVTKVCHRVQALLSTNDALRSFVDRLAAGTRLASKSQVKI